MSYESAPATQLVATNCAICARPLVDAVSVETGIGPDCRRKCGLDDSHAPGDWTKVSKLLGAEETDRLRAAAEAKGDMRGLDHAAANILVYRIAAEQHGVGVVKMAAALSALGFDKLSRKLARRLCAIYVTREADAYRVKAPFNEAFNAEVGPFSRFDRVTKTRTFHVSARAKLWSAIKKTFPAGTPIVVGEEGVKAVA